MTTGTFSLECIKLVGCHLISQQQTVFISKSAEGIAGVFFYTEEERKMVCGVRDRDIGLIGDCSVMERGHKAVVFTQCSCIIF